MQGRCLVVLIFMLAGCATKSEPVLNSTPVYVAYEELADYWLPREKGVYVRSVSARARCGVVDIRFTIDSKGDVHDVEVIDSEPRGAFDRAAVLQAESFSYLPSEGNAQRTPVRVTQYVTFDMDPTDDVDCSTVVAELRSSQES